MVDEETDDKQLSPTEEESAWFLSRLFFVFMRGLFRRAQKQKKAGSALDYEDLLRLPSCDRGSTIYEVFAASWKATEPGPSTKNSNKKAKNADGTVDGDQKEEESYETLKLSEVSARSGTDRIAAAMRAVVGRPFVIAGIVKVFNTGLQFSFPLLLNAILKFIEDTQNGEVAEDAAWGEEYRGYWLSALLFAAMVSKAVTENYYFSCVLRAGYQVRVAVSTAVYHKALILANAERQSTTLGELVNLMSIDSTKMEMLAPQFHTLWDGTLQIAGYMTILYTLIGWPCFVGLVVMVMAGPLMGIIMGKLFGLNREMVKYTDGRVKTINEALQGIQSVKMFAWEENFKANIAVNRNQELDLLKRVSYLRGFSRAYMTALPGVVAVVSFVTYAVLYPDADVSASTLFAALAAFDLLRFPLLFYPVALAQYAQAKVSAARVQKFLTMKEVGNSGDGPVSPQNLPGRGVYTRSFDRPHAEKDGGDIQVKDATIFWGDPNVPLSVTPMDESQHSRKTSRSLRKSESQGSIKSGSSDTDTEATLRYPKVILDSVSLSVQPGELCAVVGRVASGKSTLCSAILNETILTEGSIHLSGKVAYAAQSAWIMNATLRDNILFGLPMDKERYEKVLHVCQLTKDLEMLEAGDMTEIGEKGINLSGGQRQRVSVARACYSNADTIILDDPLSALDPEVASKLFQECIHEFMQGKTRLLVTNQLQFLKFCDSIVALDKGRVIEQGAYDDLIQDETSEVKRLLKDAEKDGGSNTAAKKSSGDSKTEKKEEVTSGKSKEKDSLVTKEERKIGAVSWSVYRRYLLAGGGILKFVLVVFGYLVSTANGIAGASWISFWTADAPDYTRHSQGFYLGVYASLAVSLGVVTYWRSVILARYGVSASSTLHRNLLDSILRAPQSFFDTTPLGRILNRFSKDMYSIDIELAEQLDLVLFCAIQVIASLATIVFVTPWFGVSIVPLGLVYYTVLNYFREVSRETKRLESVTRSPMYAWFSETLSGLVTIRAYNESGRFMGDFKKQVDVNTRANYNNKFSERWLALRLESIGSSVTLLAAMFACNVAISGSVSGQSSDSDFASLAGLSLTLSISLTSLMNFAVRTFANLEASMNACERVLHYTENISSEAAWTGKELEGQISSLSQGSILTPQDSPSKFAALAKGGKAEEISTQWPSKGSIVLKNLKMRYRSDTPLVLKGLDVVINGGERIGVVGRTGSGKSSLLLTLLRLVEPELGEMTGKNYESPIKVDGVDILRIGLRDLRSRLGIIPQNPVLFSGTIRNNIDPFGQFTDDQIWDALRQCNMYDAVVEMAGELEAPVAEYGENLSAGMRQMLVLGRALLRQCRILLLDEATSNVDLETDRAIQKTIREAFPGCTVLTIAHRVNTIMDSDKILVMKDGLVAEFAPPQELLQDEQSVFSEIVRHAQNSGSAMAD